MGTSSPITSTSTWCPGLSRNTIQINGPHVQLPTQVLCKYQVPQTVFFFLAIMLLTSIRWRLRSMSEGRQNSCSDNRFTGNQTETGANLMERQCRCRCRIKSIIVQLLWVGAQLPTLYNTVEYLCVEKITYLTVQSSKKTYNSVYMNR